MNVFKKCFSTLKPTFSRFPAMYLFSVLSAVFACIWTCDDAYKTRELLVPYILDFSWVIQLAVLVKLLLEKYLVKSTLSRILEFALPVIWAVPFYFLCKQYDSYRYFYQVYFALALALTFSYACLTAEFSKEKNGANLFISSMISGIIAGCVGTALTIIILAFENLIYKTSNIEELIASAWIFSFYIIFTGFFVSYSTRKSEEIELPKAFKIVFLYTLLPLYTLLLLVLYAYLIKSISLLTLPSGLINPFVSVATVVFIIFYLTLSVYKNKVTAFFYRFGSLFMIPLLVMQIIAFYIRVDAYGLTKNRYISLLYIAFSVICVVYFCIQGFRNKNRAEFSSASLKFPFFALALICVFATLPKVNIIDVSDSSLFSKIEEIYKKHDLFENGEFKTEKAREILSDEEKNSICSLRKSIESSESEFYEITQKKNILWAKSRTYENTIEKENEDGTKTEEKETGLTFDFDETFGFEDKYYYEGYVYKSGFYLGTNSYSPVEVSGFSKIFVINDIEFDTSSEKFILKTYDLKDFDITEQIKSKLKPNFVDDYKEKEDSNWTFDLEDGKYRVICNSIKIYEKNSEKLDYYTYCDGYVLEK